MKSEIKNLIIITRQQFAIDKGNFPNSIKNKQSL